MKRTSAISYNSRSIADQLQMAAYWAELGRSDFAIEGYDRVIKAKPEELSTYVLKGRALIDEGKYPEAIDLLDHVPAESPMHQAAQYQRRIAAASQEA